MSGLGKSWQSIRVHIFIYLFLFYFEIGCYMLEFLTYNCV